MFLLLIVWLKGCAMRSPSGCVRSWWGCHSPACCGGLGVSASPVIAVVASQPGAAGLGQSATPLLSPGSSCHIFDSLVLWSSLVLQAGCRRGREQRWPLPSALGRSSALCFVPDTCIKLELIGQGEVGSTVCLRLQLVQDPGLLTAAIIGVKPLWCAEPSWWQSVLASSTWAWCETC